MSFISRLLNKSSSSANAAAIVNESSSTSSASVSPMSPPLCPTAPAFQPMGQHLQRRFARGVQYNMKIVIRGEANVGKTCLLARLQGKAFIENYTPSDEIRVVSVHWSYKTTDDVIKVEVWDVVDKSRRSNGRPSEPALDAQWVDVYKGCHGVILVLDMTKAWTLAYVQRELARVPEGLPVLVLSNSRDLAQHRSVTEAQARAVIADSGRPLEYTRYAESSMRNGYGLKYIHRFLNLPFLHLQRQSLLAQLRTNEEDMDAMILELDLEEESEENTYDSLALYRSRYQQQLRARAEEQPALQQQQQQQPTQPQSKQRSISDQGNNGQQIGVAKDATPSPAVARVDDQQSRPAAPPPRLIPGSERMLMQLQRAQTGSARPEPAGAAAPPQPLTSIDNFVPPIDDDDSGRKIDSFLEDDEDLPDSRQAKARPQLAAPVEDSDDEEQHGNPMVMAFAEDIDSDDERNLPAAASAASGSTEDQDSDLEAPVLKAQAPSPAPAHQPPPPPTSSTFEPAVTDRPAAADDATVAGVVTTAAATAAGGDEDDLEKFLNDD